MRHSLSPLSSWLKTVSLLGRPRYPRSLSGHRGVCVCAFDLILFLTPRSVNKHGRSQRKRQAGCVEGPLAGISVAVQPPALKTALFPLTLPTSCDQTAPSNTARLFLSRRPSAVSSSARALLPSLFNSVDECLHGGREASVIAHAVCFMVTSYLGDSPAPLPTCLKLMVLSRGFTPCLWLRHTPSKHPGRVSPKVWLEVARRRPDLVFMGVLSSGTRRRLAFTGI